MNETLQTEEEFYLCSFSRKQDIDEIDNLDYPIVVIEENSQLINEKNKKNNNKSNEIYKKSDDFLPFQHKYPLHEALPILPKEFTLIQKFAPYSIFSLFFSEHQLQTIVTNTNIYAAVHNTKHGTNQAGEGRNWTNLTLNEFKIWLALVIYMGVFKFPAITDYWKKDSNYPSHDITKTMSLFRFQQVK